MLSRTKNVYQYYVYVLKAHILHKLKNALENTKRETALGDLFFFSQVLSVVLALMQIDYGMWEDPTTRNKMRKSM